MLYPVSVKEMLKTMEKFDALGYGNYELVFGNDDKRLMSICKPSPEIDISIDADISSDSEAIYFSTDNVHLNTIGEILSNPKDNWVGNKNS